MIRHAHFTTFVCVFAISVASGCTDSGIPGKQDVAALTTSVDSLRSEFAKSSAAFPRDLASTLETTIAKNFTRDDVKEAFNAFAERSEAVLSDAIASAEARKLELLRAQSRDKEVDEIRSLALRLNESQELSDRELRGFRTEFQTIDDRVRAQEGFQTALRERDAMATASLARWQTWALVASVIVALVTGVAIAMVNSHRHRESSAQLGAFARNITDALEGRVTRIALEGSMNRGTDQTMERIAAQLLDRFSVTLENHLSKLPPVAPPSRS